MKKIKIKVKHLVYLTLILILMRFLIIPQGIYLTAKIAENKDIQVSKVLYKRYVELAVGKEEKAKALYKLAQSIVPNIEGNQYRTKIFPTTSENGGNTTLEMINNACKYYKEIIEKYENTSYYSKAYGNTINLYMLKGNHKEAMKLIEEGIKSSNKELKVLATKYKMAYLIAEKKYEEGITLGEALIKNGNGDSDVYMLLGDINLYNRRYEDARKMYEKVKTLNNSTQKIEDKSFYYYNGEADCYSRSNFIAGVLFNKDGKNTLRGNVKINGKPVPLALVYVKEVNDSELGRCTGDEREGVMAVTDLNGNYRVEGIKDGKYELGVDLSVVCLYNTTYQTPKEGDIILKAGESKEFNFTFVPPIKVLKPKGLVYPTDDKVYLEWEKVEGAAYYRINTVDFHNPEKMEGNSSSGAITKEIYDTKATLDINQANIAMRGFSIGDSHVPNPQAYLGSFFPSCKTPIFVTAYDDENRCIGSSNAIKMDAKDMVIVSVSEKGLTEGDKLILKGQPDKALKYYEEAIKDNPRDIHSLEILSKIYSVGTKVNYEDNSQHEKRENQNLDRAFQLKKNLYGITGNSEYIKSISYIFDGSKELQMEAVEELKKLPESQLDFDQYYFMANTSLKSENFKEADMYFEKASDKSKAYVSMDWIILKMYLNDNAGAVKRAEDMIQLYLYSINKEELMESVIKANNVDKSCKDYSKFKEAVKLLLIKEDGYREEYKNLSNSIQDQKLKSFIKQLSRWYSIQ